MNHVLLQTQVVLFYEEPLSILWVFLSNNKQVYSWIAVKCIDSNTCNCSCKIAGRELQPAELETGDWLRTLQPTHIFYWREMTAGLEISNLQYLPSIFPLVIFFFFWNYCYLLFSTKIISNLSKYLSLFTIYGLTIF